LSKDDILAACSLLRFITALALAIPAVPTTALANTVSPAQLNDLASAQLEREAITIMVDRPIHFIDPDGSDLVVGPGTYAVAAMDSNLSLRSRGGEETILLETSKGTHQVHVEVPIALSIPGGTVEEADLHLVQLLYPDGTSLEATGTYSGIRPRGLLDLAKSAAAKAQAAAEAARRDAAALAAATTKKAQQEAALRAQQAAQVALKAKQEAERLALQARDEAIRLAGLAAIGTCKAAVKADQMAGELKKKVLQLAEARLVEIRKRFQPVDLIQQAFGVLERQGNRALQKLTDSLPTLNNPINLSQLKRVLDPNYLCEGGFLTAAGTLHQKLAKTSTAGLFVGTRAAGPNPGGTLSIGYQYNQAAIVGLEGGFGAGFHVPSPSPVKGYIFVGGVVTASAGSSHAIQMAYWPGKNPEDIGLQVTRPNLADAPYWALGFSVSPTEIPCLVEKFSTNKTAFVKALVAGCTSNTTSSPSGSIPIATPGNQPTQNESSFKIGVDFVFNWQGQFQGFIVSPMLAGNTKFSSLLPGGVLASLAWQPGLTTTFP